MVMTKWQREPDVPGFHTEAEEARLRGLTLRALRHQRDHRIGALPVKSGRRDLYRDGDYAQYLTRLHAEANAQPRPRGRPPMR